MELNEIRTPKEADIVWKEIVLDIKRIVCDWYENESSSAFRMLEIHELLEKLDHDCDCCGGE